MFPGSVGPVQAAGGKPVRPPVAAPAGPPGGGAAVSGAGAPAPAPPRSADVTLEQAQAIAKEVNNRADFNKFQARVRLDETTDRFVFQIHTREGGKLIRQFPPEGILFMAAQLKAAGPSGLLLDETI